MSFSINDWEIGVVRAFGLLLVGGVLGAALTYGFFKASEVFDGAISYTYRCDQLAREADARHSAEAIIERFLSESDVGKLEELISETGLQMMRFDKSDHMIIVVGQEQGTSALKFSMDDNGTIDLLPLPGSAACASVSSGD